MFGKNIFFKIIVCVILINVCRASIGDSTSYFSNCKINCRYSNCKEDGNGILPHAEHKLKQTLLDKIFQWSCKDECQYHCMWQSVNAFRERKWNVPQFYGKWPFTRILGLQEPASVLFSLMNVATNLFLLWKFRKEVKRNSPCYWLWHLFFIVCINGWIWSSIFHARDLPFTELADYASAYSIVLVTFYCMVIRMIWNRSNIFKGIISAFFLSFYLNYFAYLSVGQINYSYNMKVNIVTGIFSGIGWIIWSTLVYTRRPYFWKILAFYGLFGLAMCLEVLDFPPILWIFDAHSLWHLSSVPLSFILYSFIREDCNALRREFFRSDSERKAA